jgi:hypothetical protein
MKICQKHWGIMRQTIIDRGMGNLGAESSEDACEAIASELNGGAPAFDPNMSMHWHWTNAAMRAGGLYLMGDNPATPDGHYCPVCEFEKNLSGFDAAKEVGDIADQMRNYALEHGLIHSH